MTTDTSNRILLVEDDPRLGYEIQFGLSQAGFVVDWIQEGSQAVSTDLSVYALCVLDLMLPGVHGFDVLTHWRKTSEIPVIVLTARTDTQDKIRGFALGGDDYLTKPFWPEELVARIHARLRRFQAVRTEELEVGEILLDLGGRRCRVNDEEIELTKVEFDFVAELCRRPGEAISRGQLVSRVLGEQSEGGERTLDVHVSRIRKKLKSAAHQLETVWGIGYRMRASQEKTS